MAIGGALKRARALRRVCVAAASLALGLGFVAPASAQTSGDREALMALGARYAVGFYTNNPEIILSTVHTELSKKGVEGNFWGQRVEFLSWLQGDRLRLAGLHHDGPVDQFDASTPSEVRVYAISENIAAIELIAADWYDAFTAVRTADGWRLLDCVWGAIPEYQAPEQDAGEAAAVMAVAETFARGVASADRALLDDAIHPNLTMRSYEQHDGVGRIVPITRESLYLGAHGAANLASPTTPVHTTVHNATARTALVQIEHGRATYFVQMLRINGDWRVINVTWAGA